MCFSCSNVFLLNEVKEKGNGGLNPPWETTCHFCISVALCLCQPCKLAWYICWELPLPELKGYLKLSVGTNPANLYASCIVPAGTGYSLPNPHPLSPIPP